MGQRTCIIVQKHETTEQGTKITTKAFHEQWGLGRITPREMMTIILSTAGHSAANDDFLDVTMPGTATDGTGFFEKERLNSLDFSNPAAIGEIMQELGNNNGGIFVRFTTDRFDVERIEYAYMLGYEEDGDYKSFCSEDEWMGKFRYVDERFKELYRHTLDYFGAKEWRNEQ